MERREGGREKLEEGKNLDSGEWEAREKCEEMMGCGGKRRG